MQKKRIAIVGIIILIAIPFLYYLKHTYDAARSTTITLGWVGPLSGSVKMLGTDNLQAVKLAIKEYHASKKPTDPTIKLIVKDDGYEAFRTISAYNELLKNEPKPTAIIISTYSGLLKIADMAAKDHVILINPIDNDRNLETLNGNVFLIAKLTEEMASILINTIMADQRDRIALFYFSADYFMTAITKSIVSILRGHGIQTILFPFQPDATDFISDLTAAKHFKANAYVFLGYLQIGQAMKQARELGVDAPFYSLSAITDFDVRKIAGDALEGTQFVHFTNLDGNRGLAELFMENFKNEYHYLPALEWPALQAYDATTILLRAIEKADKKPGSFIDNLRNNLFNVSKYTGVSGDISIQRTGTSIGIHPHLYLFKDGKVIRKE